MAAFVSFFMQLHPEYSQILKRLSARVDGLAGSFVGEVFRFVDPQFSSVEDQFAGTGSLFADGRWSQQEKQRRIIYTSLEAQTAFAEALSAVRYYGFPESKAAPLVFVTGNMRLSRVIDMRVGKVRQQLKISKVAICETDWRLDNSTGHQSLTQAWGQAFAESGVEGFIVPSAAWQGGSNLIAFPDNFLRVSRVEVTREINWARP